MTDSLKSFLLNHRVEVVIGADLQYNCYINGGMWATGFTFLEALTYGIASYTETKSREDLSLLNENFSD